MPEIGAQESSSDVVSVLVVEDQPIVAVGLRVLIDSEPDLRVVGVCSKADEAMQMLKKLSPRVVVVGLSVATAEADRWLGELITAGASSCRVIVWSSACTVLGTLRCLQMGAKGVLPKTAPPERLFNVIRAIAQGMTSVESDQASDVIAAATSDLQRGVRPLSPAERNVLQMIGSGLTTRDIAARLYRSPKTIETYRSRIRAKLGLANPTALALFAFQYVNESPPAGAGDGVVST